MNIDTKKMGTHDLYRAGALLQAAANLDMELSCGEIGLNENSGNVYLWSEDYPFCLYLTMHKSDVADVWVNWSCPNCGEEYDDLLDTKSIANLEEWVDALRKDDGCEKCKGEK